MKDQKRQYKKMLYILLAGNLFLIMLTVYQIAVHPQGFTRSQEEVSSSDTKKESARKEAVKKESAGKGSAKKVGEAREISANVFEVSRENEQNRAGKEGNNQKNKIGKNSKNDKNSVGNRENKKVIPGGFPIGIYVETKGVLVVGTQAITASDGLNYEPAKNILLEGDYIEKVNAVKINNKKDLIHTLNQIKDNFAVFQLIRDGKEIEVKLKPVEVKEDKTYKIGTWVRDNTQGLGTMTYIDGNKFAALGHGISDMDVEKKMDIKRGTLYKADIFSIQKGKKGMPGEMIGQINYSSFNKMGVIKNNTKYGIYGYLNGRNLENVKKDKMEIASKKEVKKGRAYLRSYIGGSCKDYEIRIESIDINSDNRLKGMKICITDKELLKRTNGIVQGMSGSPIIQNGKLVGAVTHVFVNDPTRGYGIFIESMMEH